MVSSVGSVGTKREGDETARGRNGKGTKRPGTKRQGDETIIKPLNINREKGNIRLNGNITLINN
jgi:hypothetical protein